MSRAAPRTPVVSPRKIALDVLGRVLGPAHAAADEAFEHHPALPALEPRDRAFARLLVWTVLRRLLQLDALILPLLRTGRAELPALNLLRLGAAQLLLLGTPAHAAVHGTVELATGPAAGLRPLVNAVLRRLAQDGAASLEGLGPETATPSWLLESWRTAYGPETAALIAASHLAEPPLDLRAAADPAAWAQPLGARLMPDGTLRLAASGPVDALPGFAQGSWWVQDMAAGLPARLLGDVRDQRVLDIGAAPGGKTMQLAALGARVTALDASAARSRMIAQNLARTGLTAEIVVADAREWRPDSPFPLILLDAPCTATGTIRRHPDVPHAKSPEEVLRLRAIQDALLDVAVAMLTPDGVLVYAVCSLQPEEGPEAIEALLARHGGLERRPVDAAELGGLPLRPTAAGDLRTLPSDMAGEGGMDGFYAARLVRRP